MKDTRDQRTKVQIKIDAIQRFFMWAYLSKYVPYYLITEFPKSGGSWCAEMLAEYLNVPFIRNRRPKLFPMKPAVLHGHRLFSPRFANILCVFRDGRDVMVSAYWHLLEHNDRNVPWLVEKRRRDLGFKDVHNIYENMPQFIEYMFTEYPRGFFHFDYNEFVFSWIEKKVPKLRYEDLLTNPQKGLSESISELTGSSIKKERISSIIERYSFQNRSRRMRGQENKQSFLRKGIAGDWKNVYSKKSKECFDHFAGESLLAAGYETDHKWVHLS